MRAFVFRWPLGPDPDVSGLAGLALRFLVNVAALWVAQWLVRGFYINTWAALLVGAAIFGAVNAILRPIVARFSCLFTLLTLGLFTLIINTLMLGITAWSARQFGLAFYVDGFWAGFFGALVISIASTLLSRWTGSAVAGGRRRRDDGWRP
ncbi:MAG: phage holin family protein [Chloroflexi bacterium]|nr:phage holin family protein [Chloroflexota bacterium]